MTEALIVVDIQEGLIDLGPANKDTFLSKVKATIAAFEAAGKEVIYFRHTEPEGFLSEGDASWEVYHELTPRPEDNIFRKNFNSIYRGTGLKAYLDEKGIKSYTVVGMQAEFCIDTSLKVGFEYGFEQILVRDAVTTFDKDQLKAQAIIDFYQDHIWDKRFAEVLPVEEVVAALE
ncbi:cysteine hydrolase family protein [Streptococcus sp. DD12]|uniref:cysteine hydrolase family protein n=1 Tax=Streptococcus sp. DD12 TaxID=1777880 RepID=UPI0007972005|nr:cysteine hydrolase family protein [Streptococcus sp. DD12]KXT75653.1 Isochorismatase [Streptococcus sp. DD12]